MVEIHFLARMRGAHVITLQRLHAALSRQLWYEITNKWQRIARIFAVTLYDCIYFLREQMLASRSVLRAAAERLSCTPSVLCAAVVWLIDPVTSLTDVSSLRINGGQFEASIPATSHMQTGTPDRMNNIVTHEMAVQRLRAAGAEIVAEEVAAFRNVDGNLDGWDGWVKGKYGHRIVGIIWPEEQTRS
jgi:hypothetical protein